jgi:hypothetical protein
MIDGSPGTFLTTAVSTGTTDDLFAFLFGDAMVVNVRLAGGRIAVEANTLLPLPYCCYSGGR